MPVFPLGSKHHSPRPILDAAHCVGGVTDQIQNHLLKLDAVSVNSRQTIAEIMYQNYVVSLKFAGEQGNDFASRLIEVNWLGLNLLLAEKSSQPSDHL